MGVMKAIDTSIEFANNVRNYIALKRVNYLIKKMLDCQMVNKKY